MSAVFKKEFKAYFYNPTGYILLAFNFLVTGLFFTYIYQYGIADGTYVMLSSLIMLVVIVPLLTMKLISEDRRQKVDQALFTAPVSLTKIVFGKFFAAFAMFAAASFLFVVYQIILSAYATVNWLVFLNCLFGYLLLGAGLISMGLFFSSLTESPIIAFIITFAGAMVLLYLDSIASMLSQEWLKTIAGYVSFYSRFSDAANGAFTLSDPIYFISFTGFFIFLTIRSLEKKRWS